MGKTLEGALERQRPEELRRVQERRLARAVRYAQRNSPLYRSRFRRGALEASKVRTAEDLSDLPFTTRADLRQGYPFGLLAVPLSSVVRLHPSSEGEDGPPLVAYTAKDLDRWAALVARAFGWAGARKGDIVHNLFGPTMPAASLGFQHGAERLGLAVLSAAPTTAAAQLELLREMGSTILCCSPSQALALGGAALEGGLDPPRDLKLRIGMHWGEASPWEVRRRIETLYGMRTVENYGPGEMGGPGVAVECGEGRGLHLSTDHFFPEIVDPSTGEVLGLEEEGELVLTDLVREAMPLLRFRTGDIMATEEDGCGCGNPLPLVVRAGDGGHRRPSAEASGPWGRGPSRGRAQEVREPWRRRSRTRTR